MKRFVLISILLAAAVLPAAAQNHVKKAMQEAREKQEAMARRIIFDEGSKGNSGYLSYRVMDGDTVYFDTINPVWIFSRKQAKDINLSCKNDRQTARRLTTASNTLLPVKVDTTEKASVAGRKVGDDGYDTIVIPEVTMPCGIVYERFDVYASSGMLYVEPVEAADSPITNCICPTRVSFRIEQNEAFSNTQYLVFSREKPMPLVETVPVDASDLND